MKIFIILLILIVSVLNLATTEKLEELRANLPLDIDNDTIDGFKEMLFLNGKCYKHKQKKIFFWLLITHPYFISCRNYC